MLFPYSYSTDSEAYDDYRSLQRPLFKHKQRRRRTTGALTRLGMPPDFRRWIKTRKPPKHGRPILFYPSKKKASTIKKQLTVRPKLKPVKVVPVVQPKQPLKNFIKKSTVKPRPKPKPKPMRPLPITKKVKTPLVKEKAPQNTLPKSTAKTPLLKILALTGVIGLTGFGIYSMIKYKQQAQNTLASTTL